MYFVKKGDQFAETNIAAENEKKTLNCFALNPNKFKCFLKETCQAKMEKT